MQHGNTLVYVTSGCIRATGDSLPVRLGIIARDLAHVIAEERPTEVAVEKVFVNINPNSTLLLGQARGAAIAAAVLAGLPVHEYTAGQVKQAVVGQGRALKPQVQEMVRRLLAAVRAAVARRRRRARLRDLPRAWQRRDRRNGYRSGGRLRVTDRRIAPARLASSHDDRAVLACDNREFP